MMINNLTHIVRIIEIQREIKRAEEKGDQFLRINHLENKIAKILRELGLLNDE